MNMHKIDITTSKLLFDPEPDGKIAGSKWFFRLQIFTAPVGERDCVALQRCFLEDSESLDSELPKIMQQISKELTDLLQLDKKELTDFLQSNKEVQDAKDN